MITYEPEVETVSSPDLIIIGGGISGLSLAWRAARDGATVRVLEARDRVGGCLYSHRDREHWFEIGGHTVYNSYGGLAEILFERGLGERVVPRGPARAHFGLLREGVYSWLTPPKVLWKLSWWEAAWRFPFRFWRDKAGQSVAEWYGGLIGPKNFARILSPFFAAVPSQSADGFPVSGPGSLFKKRPRRPDLPRSFGLPGGLQSVADAIAAMEGVHAELGVRVTAVARREEGWWVAAEDGREWTAPALALATPPPVAAGLLRGVAAPLAAVLERVATVEVESVGVTLPRAACWMPECAFLVPVDDLFFSMVTRDPFPDPERRSFAFHFKPGLDPGAWRARMAEILRVPEADLAPLVRERYLLPAPAVGHADLVADLDAALTDLPIALTGNYFAGLAIEDCIQRSFSEWHRVRGQVHNN